MSKFNIQRYTLPLILLFATNNTTIASSAIEFNGLLRGLLITAPDLEGVTTFTITITDADGFVVYSKAALAESTSHAIFDDPDLTDFILERPLSGDHTITIVTSGVQTADRTFAVKLLIERNR